MLKELKIEPHGANFLSEDGQRIYLVRCPKCNTENYSPSVSSGQCAWCGFDAQNILTYKTDNNANESN